jgi:hypothetical protein
VDEDVADVVLSVVEVRELVEVLEAVVVLGRVEPLEALEVDVLVVLTKDVDSALVPWAMKAASDTDIVTPVPAQLFCIVAYTACKSPLLVLPTHCAVL